MTDDMALSIAAADRADLANQAIELFQDSNRLLLNLYRDLAALYAERAERKIEALIRLTGVTHPASDAGKRFSLSQAENLTRLDGEYAAFQSRIDSVELRIKEVQYVADGARLLAELRTAEFKALAGVR